MNTIEAASTSSQADDMADELLVHVVQSRLNEIPDAIEVDIDAI